MAITRIGPRYKHAKLTLWAEDGLVFIEDGRDGSFNVSTCADIKERTIALYKEAKRAIHDKYRDVADDLNQWVIKLGDVWKDARDQGDPADIEVAKARYRERRKAIMVTGSYW